jgi:hypothetical protein
MSNNYVSRHATDPHRIAAAVGDTDVVEVLAPSGEVIAVVVGWAAARTEVRLHALTAAVAVLEARLDAVEAKRPRRSR